MGGVINWLRWLERTGREADDEMIAGELGWSQRRLTDKPVQRLTRDAYMVLFPTSRKRARPIVARIAPGV